MEFTDNIFILFIAAFFAIYALLCSLKASLHIKNQVIGGFSLIFYGAWFPPAVLLIIGHALLAKYLGSPVYRKSRLALISAITISLLVLFIFKYYNFFVSLVGYSDLVKNLILPVGISFYTFTAIGYYVDLWRKEVTPEKHFGNLVLFLAFWPHLAAGPVLRAKNIFHNIFQREPLTLLNIALALTLITSGLFKKLVIADNIGAYVNINTALGLEGMSGLEAMATIVGFSGQIYADFSGYSDMAIGFALLLGFKLPANFNYPYVARTLTEFWHRWHISLSTWFRDYLYIPLGGNRKGIPRSYFNVFIVFFLSGIWHGAGVNFAVWGAIHGLFLMFERFFSKSYGRFPSLIRWVITIIVVEIAWAYFFLDFSQANQILLTVFSFGEGWVGEMTSAYYVAPIFLLMLFVLFDHTIKVYRVDKEGYPVLFKSIILPFIVCIMFLSAMLFSGASLPFIYFEF